MKNIFFILCVLVSSSLFGQIVIDRVISKVDLSPQYELYDGSLVSLMGYTKLIGGAIDLPAPTLYYNEGDSVHLRLWNLSQNAPHTIHLHGLDVDQQNDGVPSLSWQVHHNETKTYEFIAPHPGTYIYHCHVVTPIHLQGGMYGMLIVLPADSSKTTWTGGYTYDNDYSWMTSELDTNWHSDTLFNHEHDTTAAIMTMEVPIYEPQYFLVNGKSEQQLNDTAISISSNTDEVIYLRLANIGYHGNKFSFPSSLNAKIISSDGRPLPMVEISDSLIITPGERYGVLLEGNSALIDSIQIDYFNLNSGVVLNSQNINITIQNTIGIEHLLMNKKQFKLYPNPAQDNLTITFNDRETNVDATIFSTEGKIIKSIKDLHDKSNHKINLQDVPRGTYFIQFKNQNGSKIESHKIIKQ
jgi:FtsP/CotA-like multicopper oxidase with cupredoxin domain